MADLKISALTVASTPLAGTEVLPIVQSSTTKQVSVANLTAGRAISATQLTLTTGNVIVASGQGIDFSATPGAAGVTSELFADYEEGTWTPTDGSGAGLTFTASGTYTKVGRQVFFQANINYPVTADASGAAIGNLPFTVNAVSGTAGRSGGYMSLTDSTAVQILLLESTVTFRIYNTSAVQATNANLSGKFLYIAGSYCV